MAEKQGKSSEVPNKPPKSPESADKPGKSPESGDKAGKSSEIAKPSGKSLENAEETESKKRRTETPSPNPTPMPANMVAASPPKFISFEQLMDAANGVKNMALAHEIVVNDDFKLEKMEPEGNSIHKQVRDTMHRAFWDALDEKLKQTPPDFSHALVLIEEVRESLLSLLLPQHVRLKAQVLEVLDMDLIRQKMQNEAFDIFYYSNYVVTTMGRLCAPVRDDKVAALKELTEVVPLFKAIFELLDLMKMDMANFTIQQIRPYLQQQSVEYERQKFADYLKVQQENDMDGLEMTRHWLRRSYDKLLVEEKEGGSTPSSSPAPTSSSPALTNGTGTGTDAKSPAPTSPLPSPSTSAPTSKATPANIMNEAYMETLNWDQANVYPETLMMDQDRFYGLDQKCRQLITIASVQLVTYSTVGANIADVASLKNTLKSHVETLLEGEPGKPPKDLKETLINVAEQVKKDVNECLVEHGFKPMDDAKTQTLHKQICELAEPDNTITKLMNQRLREFVGQALATSRMDQLKVPTGFTAVETELSQVLGKFLRLTAHNRSVFGPYYSNIISRLMERQQDLSPR